MKTETSLICAALTGASAGSENPWPQDPTAMNCPHCGKSINAALRKIAAKGGKAGKGSPARKVAAQKAIAERWRLYRERKGKVK